MSADVAIIALADSNTWYSSPEWWTAILTGGVLLAAIITAIFAVRAAKIANETYRLESAPVIVITEAPRNANPPKIYVLSCDAFGKARLGLLAVFVIVLLAAQLAAVTAGIRIGVKPTPVDPRGCLPSDDRRWVESMQGVPVPELPALSHGEVCLDELRFAEALPKLQQAIHRNPSAAEASCNLVALGVAYDGLSRPREAEEAWRHANGGAEVQPTLGLEVPVLRGDSERAMRILEDKFDPRVLANGSTESYVGSPTAGFIEPFTKALQLARAEHESQGARILSALYARGLQRNGVARYARAIMLLAGQHRSEAKIELRFAARYQMVAPGEDCHPTDYQWSAIYLLEHLR